MSENNGAGRVIYKDSDLYDHHLTGRISAIQHANGRDWWIVTKTMNGREYHFILLHKDSIVDVSIQDAPHFDGYLNNWLDTLGYLAERKATISPDGATIIDHYGEHLRRMYSFDRCSGTLTFLDTFGTITDTLYIGAVKRHSSYLGYVISPNNRYLYGWSMIGYHQWDLWAGDIQASKIRLSPPPHVVMSDTTSNHISTQLWFSQLGPDDRIYSLYRYTDNIVNSPNEAGHDCDFCYAPDSPAVCIGRFGNYATAWYPNYRLGALEGSDCDTIPVSIRDPVDEERIVVFPNLADDHIEFVLDGHHGRTLDFYTSTGVHVYSYTASGNRHQVDCSDWSPGVYFYRIRGDDGRLLSRKVVVKCKGGCR